MSWSKQQSKNRPNQELNKNKVSGTCRPITEDYIFMSSEKENKKDSAEKIFKEIMAENFANLVKHINLPTEDAEQPPNRINTKKFSPKLINFYKRRQRQFWH